MAYVEVWKSGRLLTRRRVDEEIARKGCRVRLGSAGEVRVAAGQTETLGTFEVRMLEGDPPADVHRFGETASEPSHDEPRLPPLSVRGPSLGAGKAESPSDIEGYKIIEPLGEGGMGVVWRAEQLSTKRQVALKVMAAPRFTSEKARARFEREVELTARLDHPNIARIYDSGLHQGVHYYAMELIDGMPLDRHVKSRSLSNTQILALMQKVCQAVLYAHLRAVIHRDLKPSNILVSADGQPHVLDFGLAKGLLEDEDTLTISIEGQIAGTPAYMSPEQAAGHHSQLDTRTDVFSLGVILYELLTGQTPHGQSGSMFDLLQKIIEGKIRRPREINKSIDVELEAILLKALAQNPEDRYASAGTLAKDIDNYLDEEPLDACVPTTLYFLRKKINKYRTQVTVVAIVSALLLGTILVAYTKVVAEKAVRSAQATELDLKSQKLTWAELELKALGGDRDQARAALGILREEYVSAQDEISQLNHKLGARVLPVEVRRLDVQSGEAMASAALVRNPLLPEGVQSWTLETYGHRGRITTLAFSPDGSRLASAGQDGTIRIWDSESGQPQHVLADPNTRVSGLAWSADGSNLRGIAADDPNRRSVWDIESGRIRAAGDGPADTSWYVSADICWSAGQQGAAQMLDQVARSRGIPLSSAWFSKSTFVTALAFSPKRQQVACGAEDGTIWILDTASAQVAHTQAGVWCGPVKSVSFSPDRKTLATHSAAGTLCLWQADRWEPVRSYDTERARSLAASVTGAVAWAPDNIHIARADNSGTIIEILALSSGEVVRSLSVNDDRITCIAWSPEGGLIAAAAESGKLYLWDLQSDSGTPSVNVTAHADSVSVLDWMPQGRSLVTAGHDGMIRVWQADNATLTNSFSRQTRPVICAARSPDGSVLATCSSDGIIRFWSADAGWTSNLLRIDPNDSLGQYSLTAVCWSPDGKLLACGDFFGKIRIYDSDSRQWRSSFLSEGGLVSSLAWSSNGRVVLCGGADGTVRAWDAMRDFAGHVVLLPLEDGAGPGIAVSAAGDYRCPPGFADQIVYIVETPEAQLTLSPADFKSRFGWVNEPWQVGLFASGIEHVERIYVKKDAEPPCDGSSCETAFSDLQDALKLAKPDTEIWVAAGTYAPDRGTGARTASFRLKNGVRLYGGFAGIETSIDQRDPNNNKTKLSGDLNGDDGRNFTNNDENSYNVIKSVRTEPNAVIDGFVITSGNANGAGRKRSDNTHVCGGGIYNSDGSPTIINCLFEYNCAMAEGGGMITIGGQPTLNRCRFVGNSVGWANDEGYGGGMQCRGNCILENCTFNGNSSKGAGGGMASHNCKPTITRCTFVNNSAESSGGGIMNSADNSILTGCTFIGNSAGGDGGGMSNYGESNPTLSDCRFVGNLSGDGGGGMSNGHQSSPTLTNCIFTANRAEGHGGGITNYRGCESTFVNCIFTGNVAHFGGGMDSHDRFEDQNSEYICFNNLKVFNCTFSLNKADVTGGGILDDKDSRSTLVNCILWANSDSGGTDESAQFDNARTDLRSAVNHCCIQGWSSKLGGTGNFGLDPLFVDPNGPDGKIGTLDDNLRLGLASPCRNAGDKSALGADMADLDKDGDVNEPIPFDIEGRPRILNGAVDLGAYESG